MPESAQRTPRSNRAGDQDRHPATSTVDNAFVSLAQPGIKRPMLMPGTEIGRFRVKRHVGSGSLAEVYLAHDSFRLEDVAIKVVDAGPLGSETAADLLRSELAAYSRIQDYTHVLKVYDLHKVTWGGTELLILSMEYADGGTLRTWLKEHADDAETRRTQGVEYYRQLCLGINAIHEAGEDHLDVKPDNSLFVNGVLKVADFSVSAMVQSLTPRGDPATENSSGPGRIGTPIYMSPQHFGALYRDDLDFRADIYSLGVIFFEIHQGRPPFAGSYTKLHKLHVTSPIPVLPEANDHQNRIVTRCLQKDPAARYQNVGELLDDLEGKAHEDPAGLHGEAESAEALWRCVCEHIEQGRLNDARRACRQLLETHPDHADAKALRDDLEERYDQARQLYTATEQDLETIGQDALIAMLEEAVDTFSDHPAGRVVQVRLGVKARQYRQAMESGVAAAKRREWETALSHFEQARRLNPGDQEPERLVRIAMKVLDQIREQHERIDLAINAGDGRAAMDLARALDEYLDEISQQILDAEDNSTGDPHENN
ncbi:MAG TPA: serine/threonine-protein kinase [Phycisphaerae bacterium]|nr:serine/threonine-protein kinase [Phycisphaerae bacterium]